MYRPGGSGEYSSGGLGGCTNLEVQEGVQTWRFRRVLISRFGRMYRPGGSGGCTDLEVQESTHLEV